jgi:hypothetical protein
VLVGLIDQESYRVMAYRSSKGRRAMSKKFGWVIAAASISTNLAWAGSNVEAFSSSCTGINCAGLTIRGVHQRNEPFLLQVFATEGECLRVDVDGQSDDTAMLLAAPSVNFAAVSDDRDFEGGDLRPLITVDPVPGTGWYTVMVSFFDLDDLRVKFNLKYGRYPSGNPNCEALTATASQLKRLTAPVPKVSTPAASSLEDVGRDE